ncbi:MAG: nodulation protein NfeD [Chloroflexi bacterium]|nr:nodulation protein NfeD [Chloroflexota bacterium]
MRRLLASLVLLVGIWLVFYHLARAQTAGHVDVLTVKGPINPVVAGYIDRGIKEAERDGAVCLIIEMDTPGGLMDAMRDIVQDIVSARVPVVVYVSPPGARAASAGVFIAMASHVSAMAPNTNIGAAHPVDTSGGEIPATMNQKVTNDAVASVRSLAERRGRNADWAEKAVRESISSPEREALEQRVVDLVTDNLTTLLVDLEGRSVTLASGAVALHTKGAAVNRIAMTPVESFLDLISNPNIAYILMVLGVNGLIFELSNPGAILPGVVGGICLLLAFYALGTLPINYAGLALIIFAFVLFIVEVKAPTHGLLTTGGIIAMFLGSLLLISSTAPYFTISRELIAAVVGLTAAFFVFVVGAALRAQRRRVTTGREGLVGQVGVAQAALAPSGPILIDGELWEATSLSGRIEPGQRVRVIEVDGLRLKVKAQEQ